MWKLLAPPTLIALPTGLVFFLLQILGVTSLFDHRFGDLAQRLPLTRVDATPIIYVPITDAGQMGWPISRLDLTLATHALRRFYPKLVAMEHPLNLPDTFYPSYDAQLGSFFERLNLVTLNVQLSGESADPPWENWPGPILQENVAPPAAIYSSLTPPLDPFRKNVTLGSGQWLPDRDGVVRRLPLLFRVENSWVPSFPLQIYAQFLGAHWPSTRRGPNGELILGTVDGRPLAVIPTDQEGMVPLRFHHFPKDQTVELQNVVLASEQLITNDRPVFDLTRVQEKIVLIGRNHPEGSPIYQTPIGPKPSGDLQAMALRALFLDAFLRPLPLIWTGLWFTLISFLSALAGSLLSTDRSALLVITIGAATLAASLVMIDGFHLQIPAITLALAGFASWGLALAWKKSASPPGSPSPA